VDAGSSSAAPSKPSGAVQRVIDFDGSSQFVLSSSLAMAKIAFAPDQVTALPVATAAAFAWRARGQLQVTVLVKATFVFTPRTQR
jgi:hypothetical protein